MCGPDLVLADAPILNPACLTWVKSGRDALSMSALPPKADITACTWNVCFGPKADSCGAAKELFDHLIGARDDGGTGVGLRAGATDGCAGGSGIFAISSATAASNRAISRAIWS
jgi:hypothetical protein